MSLHCHGVWDGYFQYIRLTVIGCHMDLELSVVYSHIHIYTCVYISVHVHMWTHICIYIYIYIYTYSKNGEVGRWKRAVVAPGGKKERWPTWSMPQSTCSYTNHQPPTTNNYVNNLQVVELTLTYRINAG